MIRLMRLAVLYMALGLGANTVLAEDLSDLRQGDMQAMVLHGEAQDLPEVSFTDADGNELTLADLQGRHILLNFWATWCAPCRVEMPSLNAVQQDMGGDNFAVVTIATGRNPIPAIERFFEEQDITDLPIHLDPRQSMARALGIFGLPVTLLLTPEGREAGRLRGDADWSSPEAMALLQAWSDPQGEG